jgi:hypothetical protein
MGVMPIMAPTHLKHKEPGFGGDLSQSILKMSLVKN